MLGAPISVTQCFVLLFEVLSSSRASIVIQIKLRISLGWDHFCSFTAALLYYFWPAVPLQFLSIANGEREHQRDLHDSNVTSGHAFL